VSSGPDGSSLAAHIESFRRDGFVVLRGLHRDRVAACRAAVLEAYWAAWAGAEADYAARRRWRGPAWHDERPELFLPYAVHPDLLDLLMGPFVGAKGVGAGVTPVVAEEQALLERVWHRDMWPQPGWTDDYLPPEAVNVLTYLQAGPAAGYLRVLPGSHRGFAGIPEAAAEQPHPDERAVDMEPGDAVVLHSCTLHSHAGNCSQAERIVVNAFFTKCWLPPLIKYSNSAISELIAGARAREDRRLVRLFHPDQDELIDRAKHFHAHWPDGCSLSQEEMWRRWIAEDRAALKVSP
jgi:hypothetical protein